MPDNEPSPDPEIPFEWKIEAYVEALNAQVDKIAASGRRPLYKRFAASPAGRAQARIYAIDGDSRSARVFFGRDGLVRSSDSWKKAGRVLGQPFDPAVVAYIVQPQLAGEMGREEKQ